MKPITLLVTLTLGSISLDATATQSNGHYTLAVIKSSPIYTNISRGNFAKVVSQLSEKVKQSADERYENAMSLCAANIKLDNISSAREVCDNALSLLEQSNSYKAGTKKHKYEALTINNRAIAKLLTNDNDGAYQDFNQAMSLDSHPLIIANFNHFSSQMMKKQFGH